MLKPNSFLLRIERHDYQRPATHALNAQAFLQLQDPNPFYIRHELQQSGEFKLFFGERKDSQDIDFDTPINGTSITYSITRNKVIVTSDLIGAEPVYYRYSGSTIQISNRLENLVKENDCPDWVAIHCYLSFGYTLGESSFFKNIFQTLPNQRIEIDTESLELKKLVADSAPHATNTESLASNTRAVSNLLYNVMQTYSPMVLMTSAGWDSRALLATQKSPITAAYTHGDISSRECTIAKKLTGTLRMDHYFKDVKGMVIDTKLLDEMLELHGHCLWPIWHISSRFISETLCLPIASGVIGARMGGHNGFPSMGTRFQKIINSLHTINPKIVSKEKIINDVKKSTTAPKSFWFTSDKGSKLFRELANTTTKNIHDTLDKYLNEANDLSFAIEKFNYDHISRQYMMKQPILAQAFNGYYSPLSHPDLIKTVYSIPFDQRIQNRLTKGVISKLNPGLLNFPMAATLTQAKHSIFTQEVSRILRILFEKTFFKIKKNRSNFGWFNYDHLYSTDFFETTIESLNSDIWSKHRMLNRIPNNQVHGIDAGSTMDMICKIKTVDYHLSKATVSLLKSQFSATTTTLNNKRRSKAKTR